MATAAQMAFAETPKRDLLFTPEFALLCACCRPTGTPAAVGEALQSSLIWDRVSKLGTHHRILPAVWVALGGRNDVPTSVRSALGARFTMHAQRALRFSAVLREILQQFAKHGIEALPYKGPALSQKLYGDSAMREFGDLDLLLRAKDVPRARTALGELGYGPQLHLSPRQEAEYLRSGYEYVFGAGVEKSLIELQWQILPAFFAVEFDMNSIFQRSVEFTIEGCRTRALHDDDLLLILCVHAAKHDWSQLGMVRDIATLSNHDLDWTRIESEARRLGILRILLSSLLLARDLLGSRLPATLAEHPQLAAARPFAVAARLRLMQSKESRPESIGYFYSMMRLRERPQDRLGSAWRLASTPSVGEWSSVKLPDALFPLYRCVRAMRLASRAVSLLL